MIKVLQITNQMYPHIGGIEQVARDVELALQSRDDIEQKVICFNSDAKDGDIVCHKNETVCDNVDGVDVIRCSTVAKISSQQLSFSYPVQLKKVMNEFKPDIVIFHYPNPFQAQFLLKYLKRNFKFILYWQLDITKQRVLGKVFHFQSLKLLKRADKIVATSPIYIDGSKYLREYKDKCCAISCCINNDKTKINPAIKNKIEELREKYKNKIICFGLGRHVPYKGFTYLIKASKLLDERFAILIGGNGPLTEQLKAEASEDGKIEFLGRISNKDLLSYFKACDIFCFPSVTKNEAFGIALAEAMYYEKPAVTFTIKGSGVNYVNLNGVTGIECPNGDVEAYANALKKLADDPELRKEYGQNARNRVLENFTFEQFKDNLNKLLEEI